MKIITIASTYWVLIYTTYSAKHFTSIFYLVLIKPCVLGSTAVHFTKDATEAHGNCPKSPS